MKYYYKFSFCSLKETDFYWYQDDITEQGGQRLPTGNNAGISTRSRQKTPKRKPQLNLANIRSNPVTALTAALLQSSQITDLIILCHSIIYKENHTAGEIEIDPMAG